MTACSRFPVVSTVCGLLLVSACATTGDSVERAAPTESAPTVETGAADVPADNQAAAAAVVPFKRAADDHRLRMDIPAWAPIKGNVDGALITIVEVSDFECPYCARALPVVDQIMESYPDQVRIAFRHFPLPFHSYARPAALAAMAAHNQGKFWEMRTRIFQNRQAMTDEDLRRYALDLELDLEKFDRDRGDPSLKEQLEADIAAMRKIGGRGVPAFFINGRHVAGAPPFSTFKQHIEELLAEARASGERGDALYAMLQASASSEPLRPAEDDKVHEVRVGDAYWRGAEDAPVTIVWFGDYQCPYCARASVTIEQLLGTYDGKIKVVSKHFPLAFHQHARLASEAALAAGEQGKFWEMHAKLYLNYRELQPENLERYAGEIGLNMKRFRRALAQHKFQPVIDQDTKDGEAVGVRGTPAFFINGRKLSGARSLDLFSEKIDAALAERE